MKLFYYRFRKGISNFGDNLNLWLWPQLLPGVFDDDKTTLFVGIGTLLNGDLPKARQTIVFGSGVGYGQGIPKVDHSWTIYGLRGPLSAKALGVPSSHAITDSALLIRRVFQPSGPKLHSFAFMPHISNAIAGRHAWEPICTRAGLTYIDPRWPIEQILEAISQTEVLLAEAMHGAIVADALRTPWIPICTRTNIFQFKWHDWCASVGLSYRPNYVMPTQALYPAGPGLRSNAIHWFNCARQTPWLATQSTWQSDLKTTAAQLTRIAQTVKPSLSNSDRLEHLLETWSDRLTHLQDDLTQNRYPTAHQSAYPS